MHSNHVTIEGEKISKSLGNGIRLQDIIDRGISIEAVRLHILESHYRSQSKFSWESLEAAQNRLRDFRAMAVLRYQALRVTKDSGTFALRDVPLQLAESMAQDLNTPQALANLSLVSTQLQAVLLEDDMVDHFEAMLKGIDALLGLRLSEEPDITTEQKHMIRERTKARRAEDWKRSDELRDALLEHGINVRDTMMGPIWFRS
jgi:cysteinyl-tRNA synthetase